MSLIKKNKSQTLKILILVPFFSFAGLPVLASTSQQAVSSSATRFQLAQAKTLITPDFYTAWNLEQAQAWFAKHPFFKTLPKVEAEMQPFIFGRQELAKGQFLNLQISYQSKTAETPQFIQLWLVQNNPNYSLEEQRFLLPNIWQQESTQAQQLLASALGQALADDFKQAILAKEEKGDEYGIQQKFFKGQRFVYSVMTQYDENADFRKDEKGYTPYQTFFVIYPLNFLEQP